MHYKLLQPFQDCRQCGGEFSRNIFHLDCMDASDSRWRATTIFIGDGEADSCSIAHVVKQGCVLNPTLYALIIGAERGQRTDKQSV